MALGNPLPTGPLTNNGIWAGLDGSDYEFRVGTVSGGALVKGLHWTGSDLVWKATNTSLDTSGNLVAGPVTLSSDGVSSVISDIWKEESAYKFIHGTSAVGGLFARRAADITQVNLFANKDLFTGDQVESNHQAVITVSAVGHGLNNNSVISIFAQNYNTSTGAEKYAGFYINAIGKDPVQTVIQITSDSIQFYGAADITGTLSAQPQTLVV